MTTFWTCLGSPQVIMDPFHCSLLKKVRDLSGKTASQRRRREGGDCRSPGAIGRCIRQVAPGVTDFGCLFF
jgi:hypothetical protein